MSLNPTTPLRDFASVPGMILQAFGGPECHYSRRAPLTSCSRGRCSLRLPQHVSPATGSQLQKPSLATLMAVPHSLETVLSPSLFIHSSVLCTAIFTLVYVLNPGSTHLTSNKTMPSLKMQLKGKFRRENS